MAKDLNKDLAYKIAEELQNEFAQVHLTGNLMNTIEVKATENGATVEIPAQLYDIDRFLETGEIVHDKGDGSYASQIDTTGGWSGKHTNYVDRCIKRAINRWKAENGLEVKEETKNE